MAKTERTSFIRSTYLGSEPETNLIIRALQDYGVHGPITTEEKQLIRQVYLRLIWCDHLTIDFHPHAARTAGARYREGDRMPHYVPDILKK